jgi:NADP-dependent 3-hydroxy acid dehydrogenase YdfG
MNGRVAPITGASSGIGRDPEAFAAKGAWLWWARRQDELASLVTAIEAWKAKASAIKTDVRLERCERMVAHT